MIRRPPRSPLFPSPTLSRSLPKPTRVTNRPAPDPARRAWPPRPDPSLTDSPCQHRPPKNATTVYSNRGGVFLCLQQDRKSTPLNSSHSQNSYAVFCFEKKKE